MTGRVVEKRAATGEAVPLVEGPRHSEPGGDNGRRYSFSAAISARISSLSGDSTVMLTAIPHDHANYALSPRFGNVSDAQHATVRTRGRPGTGGEGAGRND